MNQTIERIYANKLFLGIIIRKNHHAKGIEFLTLDEDPMQLGYMNREDDYVIAPHVHNQVERSVKFTYETLIVRKGRVRVDFYSDKKEYLESRIVCTGDCLMLAQGGHGFKILEHAEMIEIKQGPYCGVQDKVRFEPVDDDKVVLK